jgi:hypothetical protein
MLANFVQTHVRQALSIVCKARGLRTRSRKKVKSRTEVGIRARQAHYAVD